MSRILAALAAVLFCAGLARADLPPPSPELLTPRARSSAEPSLHPAIHLLDDQGDPVLKTGRPVSSVTCGSASGCHDVAWISRHDRHAKPVSGDCLACHERRASGEERHREMAAGRPEWAMTAALVGTGLVRREGGTLRYEAGAFGADGTVDPKRLDLRRPSGEVCGHCHGLVQQGSEPIAMTSFGPSAHSTEMTGLVFSAQRVSDSALNLRGKDDLVLPWDVHAERLLGCSNCHFSPNHPAYSFPGRAEAPGHLRFDARRIEIDEYLRRPDHELATGGAQRRCEQCHDAKAAHGFLPRAERHFAALACEACHVPEAYAPALRETDWTMPAGPGRARTAYRGVSGSLTDPKAPQTGYRPVLLPRRMPDGSTKLAPYNLVTTWSWVAGPDGRSVSKETLASAFFVGDRHRPDLVRMLDQNGDGGLDGAELVLDTDAKVAAARTLLVAAGVPNPRIAGEIRPIGLHHGVAPGRFATHDCQGCHAQTSRLAAPFVIAARAPFGVTPMLVANADVVLPGSIEPEPDGALVFLPDPKKLPGHVLGLSRSRSVDALGLVLVLGVLLGALAHGIIRFLSTRRTRAAEEAL
jgi:hypothetical protein